VKSRIKRFLTALDSGDVQAATGEYRQVCKQLDKTAATSTMHKKTAARKKSRLAKRIAQLKSKVSDPPGTG